MRSKQLNYDIFISYRREGGFETAKMVQEKLKGLGYRVFLDFEELRSGKFNVQLYSKIEECKDFILICSPNCFERCKNEDDWLRLEIMHALEHDKNIVPVLLRNFEFPRQMPLGMEELSLMHGVGASEELFDAFILKLRKMFKSKVHLANRISNSGFSLKVVFFVSVLPLIILGGIYFYSTNNKPFNLSIAVMEVNPVPDLPFTVGQLTMIFGNKTEVYKIEKEVFIRDIPASYRKTKGKIQLNAFGYNTLDTSIILDDNRTIVLPVERDNSLGKIFGIIIDENDNPIEKVHLSVLDISTFTNEFGHFELTIPRDKQKKEQNLRAIKKGYKTYDRSCSFFSDKEAKIVLKSIDYESN